MSKALKCDRCGCCFDPMSGDGTAEFVEFRNPIFRTAKNIKLKDIRRCLIPDALMDDPLDLCPSCTREFETFMHCESKDDPVTETMLEAYRKRVKDLQGELNICQKENKALRGEVDNLRNLAFSQSSAKAYSEYSDDPAKSLLNAADWLKDKIRESLNSFTPISGGDYDSDD